ncbi:MAG: PspC domain-containing protein [Sphingobacteriales bacterium]|nr:MAG: PspC domain-containing protein [Sphingobacteriales bacterium]
MKKVININFQGRVIPIEETAFEMLKQYSDSLRVYFANEDGRDEIINDIENRIAELFDEKIKKGAVCITDADVEATINSMGRPADFDKIGGAETGSSASSAGSQTYASAEEVKQPRRLCRSGNDKIVGGVAAGLAHYLRIDPAVMRILFAVVTFGGFGAGFLLYIVLWIVLPVADLDSSTVLRKRLYRNPDDKVIGGVASGIAAYFNIEVWIPRIIFAAPFILGAISSTFNSHWWGPGPVIFSGGFGGTLFVTYIVLWIVLPLANTAAEKLEMRGEKVDLESIKNTVKEELQSVKGRAEKMGTEFKEKAQEWGKEATERGKAFAAEAGPVARKTGHGFGHAIGVLFKAFFLLFAGVIVFVLFILLIIALVGMIGAAPFAGFLFDGTWQTFLAWATLILFIGVPIIAIVVWLVRRIAGIRSKKSYLGYAFGTLWTLGWVAVILFIASITKDFKNQTPVKEDIAIQQPANGTLKVKAVESMDHYYNRNWFWFNDDNDDNSFFVNSTEDSLYLNTVRVKVVKSEDSSYHVHIVKISRGDDPKKAETKAKNIHFTVSQQDSVLLLPKGFTIGVNDKYRTQRVMVVIEVPNGKKVVMDKSLAEYKWFDVNYNRRGIGWTVDWDDNWDRDYSWGTDGVYQMTDDGLKRTDKKDVKIKSGKIKIDENGVEGEINVEENDKGEPSYRYKKEGDTIKIIPAKPASPKTPEKKEDKKTTAEVETTESLFPFTKVIDVI